MPETMTVPLDSFYNSKTSTELLKESSSFRTVEPGSYGLQATKIEGKRWPVGEDPETKQPIYMNGVHITASVLSDGAKKGTVFFDASWELRHTAYGPDRRSKLWGQIVKALYPGATEQENAERANGEVLDALLKYPVKGYISEAFTKKNGNGYETKYAKTKDEQAAALKDGFKPVNKVQNITRY